MGDYASGRTLRGCNVSGTLYKDKIAQSVFVAEEIDVMFDADDLATDPLSANFTQHEVYPNSVSVTVKGLRKGNRFLELYAREFLSAAKGGRPMDKYTMTVAFYDPNTRKTTTITVVEGALKADTFSSGARTAKQGEGFTLQGNLDKIQ